MKTFTYDEWKKSQSTNLIDTIVNGGYHILSFDNRLSDEEFKIWLRTVQMYRFLFINTLKVSLGNLDPLKRTKIMDANTFNYEKWKQLPTHDVESLITHLNGGVYTKIVIDARLSTVEFKIWMEAAKGSKYLNQISFDEEVKSLSKVQNKLLLNLLKSNKSILMVKDIFSLFDEGRGFICEKLEFNYRLLKEKLENVKTDSSICANLQEGQDERISLLFAVNAIIQFQTALTWQPCLPKDKGLWLHQLKGFEDISQFSDLINYKKIRQILSEEVKSYYVKDFCQQDRKIVNGKDVSHDSKCAKMWLHGTRYYRDVQR
jgi:hypothetical protein